MNPSSFTVAVALCITLTLSPSSTAPFAVAETALQASHPTILTSFMSFSFINLLRLLFLKAFGVCFSK